MANGLRIIPQTIRSIDSATFTGSYQKVGAVLPYAACLVKFINNSSAVVTISWDGTNDHDVLIGGSFTLYDVCSDAGAQRGLYIPAGTQFWVKGSASSGLFYIVVFNTSEY